MFQVSVAFEIIMLPKFQQRSSPQFAPKHHVKRQQLNSANRQTSKLSTFIAQILSVDIATEPCNTLETLQTVDL